VTIHHRVLVNVKLVMKWLQDNITTTPDRIFVTGVSAGSYTAVMSFPYIHDLFPGTQAYVLGDSGVGVSGINGSGQDFFDIIATPWGAELHTTFSKAISGYSSYKEAFAELAADYPDVRFAQFTAKWDKIQSWFYDIQTGNNINLPDTWGSEFHANPADSVIIDWNTGMESEIDVGAANYTYYIGPGGDHTILLSNKFYSEKAAGTSLRDWVSSFINDASIPPKVECTDCGTP
jgi:hypothetical protein